VTDTITSNAVALRVATIHEHVSIFAVFERMGVDVTPETQQMRCPFHPDRTPSARVYADQNTLYCFTCQKGWDVIGCVTDHFRLTFLDALAWLEAEFALGNTLPSLGGQIRMALDHRPRPDVKPLAAHLETRIIAERDRLGYRRFTSALLALDLTVYEAPTLTFPTLTARLRAVMEAIQ
jgi:hypothetical protein